MEGIKTGGVARGRRCYCQLGFFPRPKSAVVAVGTNQTAAAAQFSPSDALRGDTRADHPSVHGRKFGPRCTLAPTC